MPVIPFISDTEESLEKMFSAFKEAGAQYVMSASMTLFGNEAHDSRILMFNAVRKHFPHLSDKFQALFNSGQEPEYEYQEEFYKKTKMLLEKYRMKRSVVEPGSDI